MFLKKSPTRISKKVAALTAMVAVLAPTLAHAADVEYLTQTHGNILWTLVAAILVMLMQAGFGCVEAGFTRAKSAGNILMKNFLDFSAGSITFFLFGFAIMFGMDAGGFIGTTGFALGGVPEADLPWTYTFWFFQSVFAATAVTIVSGGMAERTKFSSYIIISIAVTGIIYPISGHWAWGSLWLGDDGAGWLEGLGLVDFAGSSVVHSVGGWIALAGAMVLGPRLGKYTEDGKARALPGHNIPLAGLGVFILWFGWFGFNPGSTTTADGSIGYIAMNTSLSAGAGVLGAMALSWMRFGKPDISMTFNGALAGLVGITAGCATVSAWGSIIIGVSSGLLVVLSIEFIDKVLKIDDPVGAFRPRRLRRLGHHRLRPVQHRRRPVLRRRLRPAGRAAHRRGGLLRLGLRRRLHPDDPHQGHVRPAREQGRGTQGSGHLRARLRVLQRLPALQQRVTRKHIQTS